MQLAYLNSLAAMRGLSIVQGATAKPQSEVRYIRPDSGTTVPVSVEPNGGSAVAVAVATTAAPGAAAPVPSTIGPTGPKKSTLKRKLQRARKAEREREAAVSSSRGTQPPVIPKFVQPAALEEATGSDGVNRLVASARGAGPGDVLGQLDAAERGKSVSGGVGVSATMLAPKLPDTANPFDPAALVP